MDDKKQRNFHGFSKKTFDLLKGLRKNNNRAWYEEHRHDYDEYVLKPMQDLVMDLGGVMLTIDQDFQTSPAVGKAISRIYRDTRFSKDKSPYKTKVWAAFKRPDKDCWQDAPAYFFEIGPDSYMYGMGFYAASSDTMKKFRDAIDSDPDEFLDAISFYRVQEIFRLEGEKYKRILDASKPDNIQEWYQRKSFYLVCERKNDSILYKKELFDELVFGFVLLSGLYRYLWKIKRGR